MIATFIKSRRQSSRRAITLLEVLLAIAVGVGVIITAVLLYMNAGNRNKINEAFTEINAIASGIRNLYSAQSTYGTGDMTSVAIDAGIVEAKWTDGDTIVNPWGGNVAITALSSDNHYFTLAFEEVPSDACSALIALNTSGFGGALKGIKVGSGAEKTSFTAAEAATACADGAKTITWTMR